MSGSFAEVPQTSKDRIKQENALLGFLQTIHNQRTNSNVMGWMQATEGMIDSLSPEMVAEIDMEFKPYLDDIKRKVANIQVAIGKSRTAGEKLGLDDKKIQLLQVDYTRQRFLVARAVMYKRGALMRTVEKTITLNFKKQ